VISLANILDELAVQLQPFLVLAKIADGTSCSVITSSTSVVQIVVIMCTSVMEPVLANSPPLLKTSEFQATFVNKLKHSVRKGSLLDPIPIPCHQLDGECYS
jgi:hypothetical protein